jgi:GWxTD domain-containing protein
LAVVLGLAAGAYADKNAKDNPQSATDQTDPLKRAPDARTKREQAKALKTELSKTYKRWLDEDVRWIITDEERAAFRRLSNDEERDNFIEQFWERRNPTPETTENAYKEEHYRRIAYANEHFSAGIPGWRSDRGRIYVMYGAPDTIDAHPSGGMYQRPLEEGGGTTTTFPFETWRYRYIEGQNLGNEVEIEFVDSCQCGDYHMTMDRSEKDALLHTPSGLTPYEESGRGSKTLRFNNAEPLGAGPMSDMQASKQFERVAQFAALNRAPQIKFKDLEEKVTHKISINLMPFDVRWDFVKITGDTVLVPVTIQVKNHDVTFVNKEGVQRGTVNIFGRATTLTGRIAQTFEDTVQIDVPADLLPKTLENSSVYWKALPLRPGRYRLDLVLKDVNGDRVGTWSRGIVVPEYNEDKLASSTLIVADLMEKVASKNVGAGSFVIGNTKVRPRVDASNGAPASFKRGVNPKVYLWMQVYNLGIDPQTHKPDASIQYEIVNAATKQKVVDAMQTTGQMTNAGEQITLENSLSVGSLAPGTYQVTVKVDDKVSKQTITPTARFAVE